MLRKFFNTEINMMIAIGLNAIIIFFLSFPSLEQNVSLIIIDDFFIIFFLIEALLKIRDKGFLYYWSSHWNKFDFFVAIGSLPLLFPLLLVKIQAQGIDPFLILLLRMFRLLRLVRFFWFVPNLAHLLRGLARAFKASIFVLIILLFFNFILSILTTHLYGSLVPEYFGNPLRAFYTIFQLFTVEGWNEIPEVIADASGDEMTAYFSRTFFAIVVLIGGIFGMSLANAIFVDEMTLDNNEQLEQKIDNLDRQLEEIKGLLKNKKT